MSLDPSEIARRLAYIRYLHQLGNDQARLPEPMCSAALLMFHDAVETFLLMAGEHLGAPSTYEFEKYWTALSPAKLSNGVSLPVQQGMIRLNRQRIALKHHGSQPNQATVKMIETDTGNFLVAASQLVFSVDYESVSMANVVPQAEVRTLLVAEEAAAAGGDRTEAMVCLVDAWEQLFNPWPPTKAVEEHSPFRFGPDVIRTLDAREIARYLHQQDWSGRPIRGDEHIGEQLAGVTEIVRELQAAARLTTIGVDFAAYQRFMSLTPHRDGYWDGRREYRVPETNAPTGEDLAFCFQFVVTAALRLASAEAQLVAPAWADVDGSRRTPWKTVKTVKE